MYNCLIYSMYYINYIKYNINLNVIYNWCNFVYKYITYKYKNPINTYYTFNNYASLIYSMYYSIIFNL